MMPGRTRNDERFDLIQKQLEAQHELLTEVKNTVTALQIQDLGTLKREVAILQYQARRTGSIWGALVGAVISIVVSVMAAWITKK